MIRTLIAAATAAATAATADRKGVTAVEYAVLAVALVTGVALAGAALSGGLQGAFTSMTASISGG